MSRSDSVFESDFYQWMVKNRLDPYNKKLGIGKFPVGNYSQNFTNDQLDYDQKKEVLNSVWSIAFADGEMDKHEEHLIRRIADLLYLNHKDFINAKLNQKDTNENS